MHLYPRACLMSII